MFKPNLSLTLQRRWLLLITAYIIVAFGQPVWSVVLSICAAFVGYAIAWRALLSIASRKQRFWWSTGWFALVSATHLSWMASHHYIYIYFVHFAISLTLGLQFGLLTLFLRPDRLRRFGTLWMAAAFWTVLEWLRLFFMSGYTWNPVGLALTSHVVPLQVAAVIGIYGLSFWVILCNLAVLRAWIYPQALLFTNAAALILLPIVFGWTHLAYHQQQQAMSPDQTQLTALVVQPHFPVEADESFSTPQEKIHANYQRWWKILQFLEPYRNVPADLIVLPETTFSLASYWPVYPLESAKMLFTTAFDSPIEDYLPELSAPYAKQFTTPSGSVWLVSNAYIAQVVANAFDAQIIVGMQDEGEDHEGTFQVYNAATQFCPFCDQQQRYEKRVLLPLGEYIPFEFLRTLAAKYGVGGSFTAGTAAKLFQCPKTQFGVSICYEETFGDLMRDNRLQGAQALVNLTNDGWYPNSSLAQQHFDHAKLRSVELGIPLIRAANTGVSGAVDSLGHVLAVRAEKGPAATAGPGAFKVDVPLYNYQTIFTWLGDGLIIGVSLLSLFMAWRTRLWT